MKQKKIEKIENNNKLKISKADLDKMLDEIAPFLKVKKSKTHSSRGVWEQNSRSSYQI